MKQDLWFPTPIWLENDLFNKSDLEQISLFVKHVRNNDKGRKLSNVGGWQSNILMYENYLQQNISFLHDILFEKAKEAFLTLLSPLTLTSSSSWININSKGDWNHIHIHPGSLFSCVFYLTDGSGIKFIRPNGEMDFYLKTVLDSGNGESKNYSDATYDYIIYKPQRNTALFFPSFLKHGVEVNDSDNERISIAFNFG